MKKPLNLRIVLECSLGPNGSMDYISVSLTCPRSSGYALADPFHSQILKDAPEIFKNNFTKKGGAR